MVLLGRMTGTSLAELEAMYWDRALRWWPDVVEMAERIRRR